MSNPTPDHNVTRDNQQTEAAATPRSKCCNAQMIVFSGDEGTHYYLCTKCQKPTDAIGDGPTIPAPTQPSGDGQRTPRTDEFYNAHPFPEHYIEWHDFARELERENNALRARVAELERPCGWPNCDPAKTCIEKLQAAVRNSDQNLEALLDLRAQLQSATERADALRRECEQAREKQKELNRRCQHAESVIAKSGIMEGREQGPKNRSLGRALANYAAAQAYRERDTARDELAKVRTAAEKLAEALEKCFGQLHDQQAMPDNSGDLVYQQVLTAYRSLAAGQGEGAGM